MPDLSIASLAGNILRTLAALPGEAHSRADDLPTGRARKLVERACTGRH